MNQTVPDGPSLSTLRLRQYRPGDWQAMHALDLLCFDAAFQFSRRAMRGFAEAPGAVTLLAEVEAHELAGFCIAQSVGHARCRSGCQSGYLVTLDVATVWRQRGLARRLMEEAESRLRAAGAVAMDLHVFTGNANAIRFYEGIGYERTGTAVDFYARGLNALLYRKKLLA